MKRDAARDKMIPFRRLSTRRALQKLPKIQLGRYKRLSTTALNTLLMEPTCSTDEQRIQLLSAEDSETGSNPPEIQLHRPQSCLNRYCKILVITPLLVALLLLTYWITTRGIATQTSPTNGGINESLHVQVNHSTTTSTLPSSQPSNVPQQEDVEDIKRQLDGCHVGLYTLAKIQLTEMEIDGASNQDANPMEIRHHGEFMALHEQPGHAITADVLVHESPTHTTGGSSFMAFISGDHSTATGFFTDNKNGTYSVCCPIPPECVNITIRLYSYDYSAYKTVKELWTNGSVDIGIRTVYQTRLCPSQASMEAGMNHVPPKCTQNSISMKPGSWIQINSQWFWKSHQENCLVPDMSVDWMLTCNSKMNEMHFFGDITSHWYSFYVKEYIMSLPNDPLHPLQLPRHTFTFSCKDIHAHLFGIQTVPDKLTYVVIHCGSNTFFEKGFTTLQFEITALFEIIKTARIRTPNLRFIFILSTLKRQFSKARVSQYSELNLFSSAAVNSWIADLAGTYGISVFDDLYPKTMGVAHIGIVDKPLANLLMYQMCNIN